ncbi:multiple sugar transport system permease protein [Amycolatopsis bartoniae]|uniref:ABC transporter permease n=1 Tax=Amycolatopsis bartoniae TaxID=941986 RepID=A0A8H9MCD3_9PSEU|nr:sugar ABC transporter permease [Amycolatopsis bartoniae]MBB2937202.1 multiple sugar transport system permease protein [Amycolatopsis bartoniae]TVS98999.1 sugar ABC transporter permease [Amycolatopsis bartoniae]GHF53222.1 ABC transporter permease [Amycolatopsis bartoniae]
MTLAAEAAQPTTRRPPPAPRAPRRSWVRVRRAGLPYLFLLPAVVFELLVHVVPMVVGVFMSFRQLTQFFIRHWSAAPFTGLANYRFALDFDGAIGQRLLHSFGVTCAFTVLAVAFSWLLGTGAALLMQDPFRGRGLLRTYFLVPYALPAYTAAITWEFLFQRDNGLVNRLLVDDLHLFREPPFWLLGGNSFFALVITAVWRMWPFAFLVVTAGLQNIPQDLYEAAALDGAGVWRRIRSVTLPQLRPVNQVLVLVLFLWNFNDFNTPYVLFGNVAPPEANLVSLQIYDTSFHSWNFGSGSAMSVLLLLFLLVVTAAYLFVTNRRKADA